MRGTGRRRAGEDNVRLRAEAELRERQIAWHRSRLRELGQGLRTWRARAQIAEGRLDAADELIQRQVEQLMERDSRIDRLQRQLKSDAVRTQEIPVVTAAELAGGA